MTNNYNSEWRIYAKIVAIIDLIFVVMQLLLCLFMIFFAGAVTVAISDRSTHAHRPEGVEVAAWTLWFFVAITVIQTGVGLWAAVQLIKATKLGRESEDAYKRGHSWQIVWLVFIVINVVLGCIAGKYVLTSVNVLIRVIFMFIVFRYMQEVQAAFITTPPQIIQRV
ncbi:uncharacterized protein LOC119083523 [Bradysia coprophila]|uniref:uncharacterized protein LOC119083523 n=1 Tax=Bradysia coprophila TaxID=38358 RepID=UPI00187D7990|nr:uncharacterized protein LOC119083523 [Bradysia coprophila]